MARRKQTNETRPESPNRRPRRAEGGRGRVVETVTPSDYDPVAFLERFAKSAAGREPDPVTREPNEEDDNTVFVIPSARDLSGEIAPADEDGGDEWTGQLPPADPADEAHAVASALVLADVADVDLDLLWDWVRADEDRGYQFLGTRPVSSREMRKAMQGFVPYLHTVRMKESEDSSLLMAFVGMGPVVEGGAAVVHCYIAPDQRGHLSTYAQRVLQLLHIQYPNQTEFAIMTDDLRMATVLQRAGLAAKYLLTWRP